MATTKPARPVTSDPMPLHDEAELRRVLVDELLSASSAARAAVAEVDGTADTAVHDYRKALRRARAVLDLVAGALPKAERKAIRKGLREARSALGAARDRAVAPEAIASLALAEPERLAASAVLDAASAAAPTPSEIQQALAEGAARAAAQIDVLVALLPTTIEWSTVVAGVRDIYRAARRARKQASRSRRAFHRWRRRSKELTYQLELLARHAGPNVDELHRAVEAATDSQGPAVDLIMVRDLVREHREHAGDALSHLRAAISEHLDASITDARKAGRAVFRTKPRKFVRSLAKAARADVA
jgi:CHAD domain-containing protein